MNPNLNDEIEVEETVVDTGKLPLKIKITSPSQVVKIRTTKEE